MWTVIGGGRDQVGESPVWDAARNSIWWVDTWGKTLNLNIDGQSDIQRFTLHEMIGGIALATDGSLRVFAETGMFHFDLRTGVFQFMSAPANLPPTHRFNDVTVDPGGRIVAGTMRKSHLGLEPTGVLYVLEGSTWRPTLDGFWTVNGLAFSPDGRTLYVSDSHPSTRMIWSVDYEPEVGPVGGRKTFVDMSRYVGRPDGAAVDDTGCYWTAGVGGGCLYQFAPTGRLMREVEVPVERPTKPVFGGQDLDRLFVTSMSVNLEGPDASGMAGALLCSSVRATGSPIPACEI